MESSGLSPVATFFIQKTMSAEKVKLETKGKKKDWKKRKKKNPKPKKQNVKIKKGKKASQIKSNQANY